MIDSKSKEGLLGHIVFPPRWRAVGPVDAGAPVLSSEELKSLPDRLEVDGQVLRSQEVSSIRNQYDFRALFGEPPYSGARAVYVFVPLDSPGRQDVTLGIGADWYVEVWLNGEPVFDTLQEGNVVSPPSIDDYHVTVRLERGENVLAVRLVHGKGGAVLALGGPNELRQGDFTSIVPPRPKMDAAALAETYPPDPEAPIRWVAPAGFDPTAPDLGMPPLEATEHTELFHALPSAAPLDDGGPGVYESLRHGTWNHSLTIATFRDRLIVAWHSHAMDEGGPGVRVLARVGKVLNERGDVDWSDEEAGGLLEIAPPAVSVRRRKTHSDRDRVRGAQARGAFCLIDGRLIFCGYLSAKHGVSTDQSRPWHPTSPLRPEQFYFGQGPNALRAGFVDWDLGFHFYQEWDVRDDRLQAVSPLYAENPMPTELALTTELSLPLEPVRPPYRDAPLLADAPPEFQALIRDGKRQSFSRNPKYRPGTEKLAHDGLNGLAHRTEYRRPDGTWVAVRENQYPRVQPFYYAAEKPDAESFYPPARRTTLYGAVNPDAGELPDGSVYLIGNSPNRRTMFITLSHDGRVFDRTWFLLHRQLSDYTPGAMKRQGGPGGGPQYFVSAIAGASLWIAYSISKEHIGATRVPLEELR